MCRATIVLCLLFGLGYGAAAGDVRLEFEAADHGDPGDKAPIVQPWKRVTLDPAYGGDWVVTGGRGLSLLLGDMTGDGVSDMTVVTGTPSAVHVFKNEKGKKSAQKVPLGCGVNHTLY